MVRHRRAAASARHAEGPACCHADAAGLRWAEDPSNRDQRFERARMRADGEALAKLGLTPEALARSARRLRRARAALDDAARTFLAHPWRHERSRLLPHRARRAHRRAGRNRASRAGAIRQCRQRQRESASACEARIASRRLKRKSEGRAYARRLPPPAARRTAWRVPRDEGQRDCLRSGLLPENARCGTTASPSSFGAAHQRPSRSRPSARRAGAIFEAQRLGSTSCRASPARRCLRASMEIRSWFRLSARAPMRRVEEEFNSARASSMRLRLSANVPHLKDGIEEPCTS